MIYNSLEAQCHAAAGALVDVMTHDIVYGIHAVRALLDRQPERIAELLFEPGRKNARLMSLRASAEREGIVVREFDGARKQRWESATHQGVVAVVVAARVRDESWLAATLPRIADCALVLILDGVTDPQNFGACLRSADAAGVDAVIIPKDNSVGLTPVVRKVACGAAETVPVVEVTNLARCLKRLQGAGIWLVGADGGAEKSVFDTDFCGPVGLVMGSEGKGLRRLTRKTCDFLARIPMRGTVASLNVSVATGICLFEAVRQRSDRVTVTG